MEMSGNDRLLVMETKNHIWMSYDNLRQTIKKIHPVQDNSGRIIEF